MKNLMESNEFNQENFQNNMNYNNSQDNSKYVNYGMNNSNYNNNMNNNIYRNSSNGNKKTVIIVILILCTVAVLGVIIYLLLKPKEIEEVCVNDIKITSEITVGNKTTISNDKGKEFTIDSVGDVSKQLELAKYANNLEGVELNICYKEIEKEKQVQKFEFINKESKMKYKSTTKDELLEEAGFHKAGEYNETAVLVNIDQTYGYGMENEVQYIYHKLKFKMNNGKVIDMQFRVYNGVPFDFKNFRTGQMYNINYKIVDNVELSKINYILLNMV